MKSVRENIRFSNFNLDESTFVINQNYGEGFIFEVSGKKIETKGWYDKNDYRKADLRITSFIGALGAEHYYGSIKVHVSNESEDGYSVGGYLGGIKIPQEYETLSIDIVKEIEDFELANEKFKGYQKGDKVRGFYTEKEVIKLGKKIFKEIFVGKWVLEVDGIFEKDEKVYKTK
jgi:hypothetical protein